MKKVLSAIYENGVLRPVVPEALTELTPGQEVWLIVRDIETDPVKAARREKRLLNRLRAEGMLDEEPIDDLPPISDEEYAAFKPIAIEGEPLSETVIKMRGEG
jgi:predicted DNA-binding antitoxin AbrB/MazE fold protein